MYTVFSMKILRLIGIVFFTSIIFVSFNVLAADVTNAGFTGDTILVSNNTPVVGETVRLSIPLYNESTGTIYGTVRLYEKDKMISEKSVILKSKEFASVTFPWVATTGSHSFKFLFEDTTIQYPKKTKEVIVLQNREANIVITTKSSTDDKTPITNDENTILKEYTVPDDSGVEIKNDSLDSYRQDFLYDIERKIQIIKNDISNNIKSNEEYEKRLSDLRASTPRKEGSLLTPLQYLYAWLLGAAVYIMGNMYLFYGIIALVLFLLIRTIIKRARHRGAPYRK